MRGTINAIWLSNNGKLHPKVIPNLTTIVHDATSNDFQVVLWTNKNQINEADISLLTEQDVLVKDYSECSSSKFYRYFIAFFERGIQGDKAAFALASDILRMSVLELSADNQYYIYFDPNDVTFPNFRQSLEQLEALVDANSLGLSFYVMPLFGGIEVFHIRNDVLIAKKDVNPLFFNDYLAAYKEHLEATSSEYFQPKTDKYAQELARKISNQTGYHFFQILLIQPIPIVKATFGPYEELFGFVNCSELFPYERHAEDANTWLPDGLFLEEKEEIERLNSIFNLCGLIEKLCIEDDSIIGCIGIEDDFKLLMREFLTTVKQHISSGINSPSDFPIDLSSSLPKRLMPSPERKLITYPEWDEARIGLENTKPQAALSFSPSFFCQTYRTYLSEHRHDSPQFQEEYDQHYGLVTMS